MRRLAQEDLLDGLVGGGAEAGGVVPDAVQLPRAWVKMRSITAGAFRDKPCWAFLVR